MKQIVFRVDSSRQMGSGHLMRCLTLAKRLKNKANISFISRDLEGNLNHLIQKNEFQLLTLPQMQLQDELIGYEKWLTVKPRIDAMQTGSILKALTADCLIVDHYALSAEWEQEMRPYVKKIMVIDDLANREHDCDILLDQNYYLDYQNRYRGLVSDECRMLLGPQYVILRDEFYEVHKNSRIRNGEVKNILIFFGGVDSTNETMKAMRAVMQLRRENIFVNVVVGASNPQRRDIEDFCKQHKQMHFHCQIDYMAQLMNEADLAIGAGGTTTWERCFLGLPAIVIAVAENQVKISEDCASAGYIIYLGRSMEVNDAMIYEMLIKIIVHRNWMNIKNHCCLEGEKNEWIDGLFAACSFE